MSGYPSARSHASVVYRRSRFMNICIDSASNHEDGNRPRRPNHEECRTQFVVMVIADGRSMLAKIRILSIPGVLSAT